MDEQNIRSEDYIDLAVLKKIIVQILFAFFAFFRYIIKVFNRSKLLLLAGLIVGLVLGYSQYSTKTKYYEVTMIIESTEVLNKTIAEMLKQLNNLVRTGSHKKLSAELKISENEARQVMLIEPYTMKNEALETDTTTRTYQPFKIMARIKDPEITDKLQNAIFQYLNENPFSKKVKDEDRKMYVAKLAFIDKELSFLDTLKKEYNHFLASGKLPSNIYNNAMDPANIYIQSNSLADQRDAIVQWMNREQNPVMVIDNFKCTYAPQSFSLSSSLITSSWISMGICFLLGLFIELNKTSKAYIKTR